MLSILTAAETAMFESSKQKEDVKTETKGISVNLISIDNQNDKSKTATFELD